MNSQHTLSDDVVIIGGGFSGLSIAALLANEGIPVTLLEAGDLGMQASTINQGWLYSGAWFAPQQQQLARICHQALSRTIRYCPDCLEPGHTGMLFGLTQDEELDRWTSAWDAAEIPWKSVSTDQLATILPDSDVQLKGVFQLPDRSIKPQILLQQLADSATASGARIHTHARVTRLNCNEDLVTSVSTGRNEDIRASLVVIATGASESDLSRYLVCSEPCTTSLFTRVTLQTHLIATPQQSAQPFCLPDVGGFNHLPHASRQDNRVSVFGMDRWKAISPLESFESDDHEIAAIQEHIRRLFPGLSLTGEGVSSWSGTTVQAMHAEQIQPGTVPLPTVIDHALEEPCLRNLLSVYPGRATLWNKLAEDTANIILRRVKPEQSRMTQPPWT